jgi:hypothetical protein
MFSNLKGPALLASLFHSCFRLVIFQSLEFKVTKQSSSDVTKRAGWLRFEFIKRLFVSYRFFIICIEKLNQLKNLD